MMSMIVMFSLCAKIPAPRETPFSHFCFRFLFFRQTLVSPILAHARIGWGKRGNHVVGGVVMGDSRGKPFQRRPINSSTVEEEKRLRKKRSVDSNNGEALMAHQRG